MKLHRSTRRAKSAGFSMIEVMIAFTLVVVLLFNTSQLIGTASKAGEHNSSQQELDLLADQAIDRIALALMAANEEKTLPANSAPFNSPQINYETSLGVEDGKQVWSDPERISLDDMAMRVLWERNPDTEQESQLVWGKWVSEFLLDEQGGNEADDNGNTLIDENGLSFNLERSSVQINLTLRRELKDGSVLTSTAKTRVAFRN